MLRNVWHGFLAEDPLSATVPIDLPLEEGGGREIGVEVLSSQNGGSEAEASPIGKGI